MMPAGDRAMLSATVILSFLLAANSGQYLATGASKSSAPRCASICAIVAVAPLLTEKHTEMV